MGQGTLELEASQMLEWYSVCFFSLAFPANWNQDEKSGRRHWWINSSGKSVVATDNGDMMQDRASSRGHCENLRRNLSSSVRGVGSGGWGGPVLPLLQATCERGHREYGVIKARVEQKGEPRKWEDTQGSLRWKVWWPQPWVAHLETLGPSLATQAVLWALSLCKG